ncbi:MAG: MobC family plasmid mobilization relaxosome protein [Flavobacteriales bacterium]|nr:MobC family plasmid mobilization relaxosome protein [Flavobacteriales bacterium]
MSKDSGHREKATERKKRFRDRNRTFTLSLPKKEAQGLEKHAIKKGYKVPDYLKAIIYVDMHGTGYVMPSDNRLQELSLAIRRIGNNANQLTRYAHHEKGITMEEVKQFQSLLLRLESEIREAITHPANILDLLRNHLQTRPQDRNLLIQYLYDHQDSPRQDL